MRIGVGINLARVGVLGGDFGVGLGPGGLGVQAAAYLGGIEPYHWLDFINNRALYASVDVGNVTGATGYSFTRASTGYYENADGTLELFESGQLRMKRTADSGHNLVLRSQDFSNAAWALTTATLTTGIDDPSGGTTAVTLTATSANGQILQTVSGSLGTGTNYICAIWVRRRTGSGTVSLFNPNAGGITTITPTSSWQQFSVVGPGAASSIFHGLRLATSGDAVDIAFAQINEGSSATAYVATTTTPVYAARRGDRGVLIEGARTNLLLRSQEFDNGSWIKSNFTVTANAIAAPDNTTTADLFTVTTTGTTFSYQDVVVSATAGSYSLFVKAGNIVNATTDFLFQDVTASAVRASCTLTWATMTVTGTGVSITALANGWYRITMASAALVSGNTMRCWISTGGSLTIAHSFYLWGAQLEAASFPSSYIPTVAASATRAADVLTYTAGVTYPLSLWAEFERAVDTGGVESIAQIRLESTGQNDQTALAVQGGGSPDQLRLSVNSGGASQASFFAPPTIAINVVTKGAGRVATNSAQVCANASLGTEDTSVTLPATPDIIQIGSNLTPSPCFGYTRRIAVFNSALTDAQLQTVTGS
jgi:hypothetical protein